MHCFKQRTLAIQFNGISMKHTFENCDGERIAADTLEQAARYLECNLGGAAEPDLDDWEQIDDDAVFGVTEEDGSVVEKTSREWAAEHSEPGYVSSTYA